MEINISREERNAIFLKKVAIWASIAFALGLMFVIINVCLITANHLVWNSKTGHYAWATPQGGITAVWVLMAICFATYGVLCIMAAIKMFDRWDAPQINKDKNIYGILTLLLCGVLTIWLFWYKAHNVVYDYKLRFGVTATPVPYKRTKFLTMKADAEEQAFVNPNEATVVTGEEIMPENENQLVDSLDNNTSELTSNETVVSTTTTVKQQPKKAKRKWFNKQKDVEETTTINIEPSNIEDINTIEVQPEITKTEQEPVSNLSLGILNIDDDHKTVKKETEEILMPSKDDEIIQEIKKETVKITPVEHLTRPANINDDIDIMDNKIEQKPVNRKKSKTALKVITKEDEEARRQFNVDRLRMQLVTLNEMRDEELINDVEYGKIRKKIIE